MTLGGSTSGGKEKTEPWGAQKPYLIEAFKRAEDLYQHNKPQYYGGSTIAEQSDPTKMAMQGIMQRASRPSDTLMAGQRGITDTASGRYLESDPGYSTYSTIAGGGDPISQMLMKTASGSYLDSDSDTNPYLDAMYNKAAEQVNQNYLTRIKPNVDSVFARSGRYGSGAHQTAEDMAEENLLQATGDLATNMYGRAYETDAERRARNYNLERDRMMGAARGLGDYRLAGARGMSGAYGSERDRMLRSASITPQMEAAGYYGYDRLADVGRREDKYLQDLLNADIDRFDFEQNAPHMAFDRYLKAIQGDYGGTTSSRKSGIGFEMPLGQMLFGLG